MAIETIKTYASLKYTKINIVRIVFRKAPRVVFPICFQSVSSIVPKVLGIFMLATILQSIGPSF